MRLAVALLIGLVSALACSFPDYVPRVEGSGGTSNNAGSANDADGGNVPPPVCDDNERNGSETDVDCGFEAKCKPCQVGQRCDTLMDCNGGECLRHECQAPTCRDGIRNGAETDVDCGGDDGSGAGCGPCQLGQDCNQTSDCDALACDHGKCQPAGCDDGVLNNDETDRDCGGSCAGRRCADELRCKVAADCQSGVCSPQTLRCAAPTCDDGVLNGREPTQDCGASCDAKCQLLDTCNDAADCESGSCISKRCLPSAATGQALSPAGWLATASHSFGNSSPSYAIDGNQSTDWTTGQQQVPGMWFEIDMLEPQVFFSLEIVCTNTRDDSAAALDIWLSNDGTFTEKAKANLPGEDIFIITFDQPQVARYLKISLAQGTDHWWRMDEIRVKR